jgi:hypothetical protein
MSDQIYCSFHTCLQSRQGTSSYRLGKGYMLALLFSAGLAVREDDIVLKTVSWGATWRATIGRRPGIEA